METWPDEHQVDLVQKLVLSVLGKENSSGAAEGMPKSETAAGSHIITMMMGSLSEES